MRAETGGSYNMQYPHLRPRLNLENGFETVGVAKTMTKGPSSVTVHHH